MLEESLAVEMVIGVTVGVLLGGGMCLKNHWLLKWS